jgi:hypothetical protein
LKKKAGIGKVESYTNGVSITNVDDIKQHTYGLMAEFPVICNPRSLFNFK